MGIRAFLKRLEEFFDDVRAIREALEALRERWAPADLRHKRSPSWRQP